MPKEQPTKPESLSEEFDKFVQEMETRKKLNLSKKERGQHYNPHWDSIDSSDLAEEDLAIYKKFREKIPMDKLLGEYERYRENVPWQNKSRINFSAWLGNKINARMMLGITLEDFKKQKKEQHES